ncbi:S-layer homology domain-containing protein [Paenibacillus aceris]|uniref:SLH domain-containing protein n=1 Tax=Paenibacillus aceris TaxID=869555 RepID=A0ABS4IBP1_9BACL|nr:S-layer homology domain-containing protein [Paenibacillus aceris]MBP1967886.1 hypothetical protein [Paenibacillus aceris]NHW39028.1 hypothetical protein [Paenibacillus aceris]
MTDINRLKESFDKGWMFVSGLLAVSMIVSGYNATTVMGAETTKSSEQFSDLRDLDAQTKAKFAEMISSGVFDGISDDHFGINEFMNRAQFAKAASLFFNLQVDSSLKASSYKDVLADDPANGYALPFIEAITKAGITTGDAPETYNPAGKVTKEQLAAFLIRALGKEAEAKSVKGVEDKTVSDWAKGYVELAIKEKLLSVEEDGSFGGSSAVTRKDLVLASYETKHYKKSYAISSLKATDANALTVQLNQPLADTNAVTLSVYKNGVVKSEGFTTSWSDDKETATLVFDKKFEDDTWKVSLDGASHIDSSNGTAEITTIREKIAKLEFVSADEHLPLLSSGQKLRLEFKAINQYGRPASKTASNLDIMVMDASFTPVAGEQAINIMENADVKTNDAVTVIIRDMDSGITITKTFQVGIQPMVTKIEVGDLKSDSNAKLEYLSSQSSAYLDVKAFDQYGHRVMDKALLNQWVSVVPLDTDLQKGDNANAFVDSIVGDDAADIKLTSVGEKEKDITVAIYANGSGQTVTKAIHIRTNGVPSALQFGNYAFELAQGDKVHEDDLVDAKMYIPLEINDAQGTKLTPDQIVEKADKLLIVSNGVVTLETDPSKAKNFISTSGKNKGKIAVKSVDAKGPAVITVFLKDNPEVKAQFQVNTGNARKADYLKFSTAPSKYQMPFWGNDFRVKVYDQYGQEMKYDDANQYYVRMTFKHNSGNAFGTFMGSKEKDLSVNPRYKNYKYVFQAYPREMGTASGPVGTVANAVYQDFSIDTMFDKTFRFYTGEAGASEFAFKAILFTKGSNQEINSLTTTLQTFDPKLTTDSLGKSIFEAPVLLPFNKLSTVVAIRDYWGETVTDATYLMDKYEKFAKKINMLPMKGSEFVSGNIYTVHSAASSNSSVAQAVKGSDGHWYVLGLKEGKATILVVYKDGKGDDKTASFKINVKNEVPSVSSIALDKSRALNVSRSDLAAGLYLWDEKLANKITVSDQYFDSIAAYHAPGTLDEELKPTDNWLVQDPSAPTTSHDGNDLLNLMFYIDKINYGTSANGTSDSVAIDPKRGFITYSSNGGKQITSFRVKVSAPSGSSASFDVVLQP